MFQAAPHHLPSSSHLAPLQHRAIIWRKASPLELEPPASNRTSLLFPGLLAWVGNPSLQGALLHPPSTLQLVPGPGTPPSSTLGPPRHRHAGTASCSQCLL